MLFLMRNLASTAGSEEEDSTGGVKDNLTVSSEVISGYLEGRTTAHGSSTAALLLCSLCAVGDMCVL